jgi:hypothetical protein
MTCRKFKPMLGHTFNYDEGKLYKENLIIISCMFYAIKQFIVHLKRGNLRCFFFLKRRRLCNQYSCMANYFHHVNSGRALFGLLFKQHTKETCDNGK